MEFFILISLYLIFVFAKYRGFILIRAIFRYLLLLPQILLDAIIFIVIERKEIVGFEFICTEQVNKRKEHLRRKVLAHYLIQCFKQVHKKNER